MTGITNIESHEEAKLQNWIREGFRVIRARVAPYRIEQKKKGSHGWQVIEWPGSPGELQDRLKEMGSHEKTIIHSNEQ